ncbi:MAG: LytTR family transcriptional regulator [Bacteroidales bacterium]|nr:LytTR family transcriptional regulator [Bacteroidales bacterium]
MSKIPKLVYRLKSNVIFIIGMTLWVLLFATIYTPTFGLVPIDADHSVVPSRLSVWYASSSFCIPILCAIMLVVLVISRAMMWGLTRTNRMSGLEYFVWHAAEVIVICLFESLFLSLYFSVGYFQMLPLALLVALLVMGPPYFVYWLHAAKTESDVRLSEATQTIVELRNGLDRSALEAATIKFVDEKGNVRLIVSADLVYTIEAAGNYVTILYENNGRLTRFALRNTLKAVEDVCRPFDIVRCHRSWFVNLRKIRLLRHDPDGIFAEINGEGIPDIPVSKNYSAAVIQRLSA